jgi:hypothetical protein
MLEWPLEIGSSDTNPERLREPQKKSGTATECESRIDCRTASQESTAKSFPRCVRKNIARRQECI